MADESGSDDELCRWEAACFGEVDSQPNYEQQLQEQRELTSQKLWHLFQGSATCIAHLHKGRIEGVLECLLLFDERNVGGIGCLSSFRHSRLLLLCYIQGSVFILMILVS